MFLIADMMTSCEIGEALCQKAEGYEGREWTPECMRAVARLFARETLEKVYVNSLKIAYGCDQIMEEVIEKLNTLELGEAMGHSLKDMDLVAGELVK